MAHCWIQLLLVAVAFACVAGTCQESPCNEASRSKRSSDDAVAQTVREAIEGLASLFKRGFPELGIPSLEPAKLDDFYYDNSHMGTKVKSNFTNMSLYGISGLQLKSLQASMSKMTLEMKLNFPLLTINGTYNLTGKVMGIYPIRGNDKFTIEASNVKVSGKTTLKSRSNGSLNTVNLDLDMEVEDVKVHFHKLNGGGNASGALNKVINFFAQKIFESSKPKLLQRLKTALQTTIDRKLATINIFKI